MVFEDVPTVRPARRRIAADPSADEVINLEWAEHRHPLADRRSVN
jgi:hypothetical protein